MQALGRRAGPESPPAPALPLYYSVTREDAAGGAQRPCRTWSPEGQRASTALLLKSGKNKD